MLFEWNPGKAETNEKKHGILFELAQSVFNDPFHISILDQKDNNEERWVTIGLAADISTLVVVHLYKTLQNDTELIRIISARRATKKEAKTYEEGI